MPTENQSSVSEQKECVATTDEKKATNHTREFLMNLVNDNGHKKDADVITVRFNFRFQVSQVADIIARLQKLSGDNTEAPSGDAFSTRCSKAADELINGILEDTVNNILLYSMGPDDSDIPF